MAAGRYAPSPSGDLHLGNLRTALLAWVAARRSGRAFVLRVDDLDRVHPGAEERQLEDLATLGLDWDGPVLHQSDRVAAYDRVVDELTARGLTYECFCTRREILEAPTAPHHPPGSYPGTCRDLTDDERARRRAERPAAVRLRAEVDTWTVDDVAHGRFTGAVDDLVLRRGDGVPAYNLTVVVDDDVQGVDQVVRGDDLLPSTPRQAYLATVLGLRLPTWWHVPLVLGPTGARLAKRDGAVTSRELVAHGLDPVRLIAASLGSSASTAAELLDDLDLSAIPRDPWVFSPPGHAGR